ncbi:MULTISPECIES: DUF2892 domain-containing protein [Flavobacteriaceae]|uniref:YgaP family membrane protein n=1 Tax=Flavobacteriaceae TaxID=49546 RepID=UPI001C07B0F0|nr:DUF2892 domain-containing protein [Zobellia uliginosa]MBU2947019.1 DUF2892 domain-containing protein [Zobellia uliginosa]
MKKNVGTTERIIRAILGLIIIASGFYFKSWWGIVGAIIMMPTFLAWDPLYAILNINTLKR